MKTVGGMQKNLLATVQAFLWYSQDTNQTPALSKPKIVIVRLEREW